MAIAFTSDAATPDAELVITLDLAGLHALLKATETALENGQADLSPEAGGAPPNTFGKVTVKFTHSEPDAPAIKTIN